MNLYSRFNARPRLVGLPALGRSAGMKSFGNLCATLKVNPTLYLLVLLVGFFGAASCMYLQVSGAPRDAAFLCLPFIAAPFGVVLFAAYGDGAAGLMTVLPGSVVSFIVALVPGAIVGAAIAGVHP